MKLTLLAVIILAPSVSLVKMFNFQLAGDNLTLSRARLDNVPTESLPRQFTVCSSHLQVERALSL